MNWNGIPKWIRRNMIFVLFFISCKAPDNGFICRLFFIDGNQDFPFW